MVITIYLPIKCSPKIDNQISFLPTVSSYFRSLSSHVQLYKILQIITITAYRALGPLRQQITAILLFLFSGIFCTTPSWHRLWRMKDAVLLRRSHNQFVLRKKRVAAVMLFPSFPSCAPNGVHNIFENLLISTNRKKNVINCPQLYCWWIARSGLLCVRCLSCNRDKSYFINV